MPNGRGKDQLDSDCERNRHVVLNKTEQKTDLDSKVIYERLSDDSSTTVGADRSTETVELSDISEENRASSFRERKEENINMLRDDTEIGERIMPVNSVKSHNVLMAPSQYETVSRKNIVSGESKITQKREKECSPCMHAQEHLAKYVEQFGKATLFTAKWYEVGIPLRRRKGISRTLTAVLSTGAGQNLMKRRITDGSHS